MDWFVLGTGGRLFRTVWKAACVVLRSLVIISYKNKIIKYMETIVRVAVTRMSYITNADAGCGLIKYGSSLVLFFNKFPKNTRLYKPMTTKPGEDNPNRNRM